MKKKNCKTKITPNKILKEIQVRLEAMERNVNNIISVGGIYGRISILENIVSTLHTKSQTSVPTCYPIEKKKK